MAATSRVRCPASTKWSSARKAGERLRQGPPGACRPNATASRLPSWPGPGGRGDADVGNCGRLAHQCPEASPPMRIQTGGRKGQTRGTGGYREFVHQFYMAERGGFEPPIPLLAYRFSKPTHSTALPPLRANGRGFYGGCAGRQLSGAGGG